MEPCEQCGLVHEPFEPHVFGTEHDPVLAKPLTVEAMRGAAERMAENDRPEEFGWVHVDLSEVVNEALNSIGQQWRDAEFAKVLKPTLLLNAEILAEPIERIRCPDGRDRVHYNAYMKSYMAEKRAEKKRAKEIKKASAQADSLNRAVGRK